MPELLTPALRQRWPWIGGHLQTIRNAAMNRIAGPGTVTGKRIWIAADDDSGDQLALSYTAPDGNSLQDKPLILLIHGLTGCESSPNQIHSAIWFRDRGHPVARLNLRGAGPGELRASRRYHSGLSSDVATAIRFLTAEPAIPTTQGIVAMGVSLGGAILLNHLIASGQGSGLTAALTVSTPLDLAESSRYFLRPANTLYHRYLLRRMKALTIPAAGSTEFRNRIAACRSVWEFDDKVVAPWNGFDGAEDYYRLCSAETRLAAIVTPTLMIHAADDPWIPARAYKQAGSGNDKVRCLLSPRGGHVGFHGRGHPMGWHNLVAAEFIDELN